VTVNPLDMYVREARKIATDAGQRVLIVRDAVASWSLSRYVDGVAQRAAVLLSTPNDPLPWTVVGLAGDIRARVRTWADAVALVGAAAV
jgi:hypothetical protein